MDHLGGSRTVSGDTSTTNRSSAVAHWEGSTSSRGSGGETAASNAAGDATGEAGADAIVTIAGGGGECAGRTGGCECAAGGEWCGSSLDESQDDLNESSRDICDRLEQIKEEVWAHGCDTISTEADAAGVSGPGLIGWGCLLFE